MTRLLFFLLLLIGCSRSEPAHRPSRKTDAQPTVGTSAQSGAAQNPQSAIRNPHSKNVLDVLSFVRDNGTAPEGFVGGRTFQNREKNLPQKTPDGRRINYREWDVHPKIPGKNRGPDRLVTGDDGSAWYTEDHYRTFKKID